MDSELVKIYGNRVRIRVCGLCWKNDELLLVNHKGLTDQSFWSPPGGGVEFGQTLEENLQREFLEETGLHVRVGKFLFGCEFIHIPLHGIELFFDTKIEGGELKAGIDPEIQIISEVEFFSADEIQNLPSMQKHAILQKATSNEQLMKLRGFYQI